MIFSLQQEKIEFKTESNEKSLKNIVFYILKIENNRLYRTHMTYNNIIVKKNLGNSRDLYLEFEPNEIGRYVFIPCVEKGNHSVDYLLRVYSNRNISFK